ncbi:hypothetical protein H0O02_02100 [Candidatus Micrarchaeota archaeon]|nr:hypothetical protein [Candidatus Micrarchaeota archaeon]
MENREFRRQTIHLLLGLLAVAVLLLYGRGFLIAFTFFTVIIGLFLVNLSLRGKKISLVEWFIRNFERDEVLFPGWGSACYATGVLLIATFLSDVNAIAASLVIIGVGDSVSTLVGMRGRIRFPYNRKKTLEGSIAFFLSSLPAYLFVGAAIIPAALIAAFVESLDLGMDDNITVPVAAVLFFLIMGAG